MGRLLFARKAATEDVRSLKEKKADFADCLIERIGADRECEYTCSFDKQAASAGMRLIE